MDALVKRNRQENNYLEVIYKYMKIHKKQTRITMVCIIASICMITALFSLADIGIEVETQLVKNMYGNYHIKINEFPFESTDIDTIEGISHSGWIFEIPMGTYQKNDFRILSGDAEIQQQFGVKLLSGRYAENEKEAVIDKRAKKNLGMEIGDVITVNISGKTSDFTIAGICDTFSSLSSRDSYGMLVDTKKGKEFVNGYGDYYITCKDVKGIEDIKKILVESYSVEENSITQNEMLLAVMGHGKTALAANLYLMAGILFCLVFLVSFLMITNCLNVSAREKTQLYGLLRCMGATSKQLKKCVMTEGKILWQRSVPLGVVCGIILTWCCLLLLKLFNTDMFGNISVCRVSIIGAFIGIFIGLAAVILATKSPAKFVSRVSPLIAVNNQMYSERIKYKESKITKKVPVEILIGFRQARRSKKTLLLMITSFAMNIILIFSFSVLINFIYEGSSYTKPYNPDASIYDKDGEKLIGKDVKEELEFIEQIDSVVGRKTSNVMYQSDYGSGTSFLISYDEQQFKWIQSKLVSGKLNVSQLLEGTEILVDEESGLKVGDKIILFGDEDNAEVCVGGILRNFPYDSENGGGIRSLISEKLFRNIKGEKDYSILDIKFNKADEKTWDSMADKIPDELNILDYRQSKEEGKKQFITMAVFVYGFCGIIISVVIFNIINCMSVSVWNNMKQYGMICAIGGTTQQCRKIVLSEALLYSCSGGILGVLIGIPLHRYIYENLVSEYFNTIWKFPAGMVVAIIGIIVVTTIVSVISPLQKVRKINIIDMIQGGR